MGQKQFGIGWKKKNWHIFLGPLNKYIIMPEGRSNPFLPVREIDKKTQKKNDAGYRKSRFSLTLSLGLTDKI